MDADRVQNHDDHWRDREDRDGLRGDDPRHDAHIHCAVKDDADRECDAKNGTEREAKERGTERDPRMVNERAFRGDLFSKNSVEHFHRHLMRRRQVWAFPNVGQRDQMWVFERKDNTICLLTRNRSVGRHNRATALGLISRQMHIHRNNRQGPEE